MNLRAKLHIFLQSLPNTSTNAERRTLLVSTGFKSLGNRFELNGSKILFFNELLDQLVSEGQDDLVSFLDLLADTNISGREDKIKISEFARQIRNLSKEEFYVEFRGDNPKYETTPELPNLEPLSVKPTGLPRMLGRVLAIYEWTKQNPGCGKIILGLITFSFIAILLVAAIIVQNFQAFRCRNDIEHYRTEISQLPDGIEKQKKYFFRGLKEYECRAHLNPKAYVTSFDAASGSQGNADEALYSLFLESARGIREMAPSSGSDDFSFSRFLFGKAMEVKPKNSASLKIELGKTYQAEFELQIKDNKSLSSDSSQIAKNLIENSLSKYQEALDEGVDEATVSVYIGYALILHGDFLYGNPPQSSSNDPSHGGFNREEYRKQESNSKYREAISRFDNAYNIIQNANPKDGSVDIKNDALLGESIALDRQSLLLSDKSYHQHACIIYRSRTRSRGYLEEKRLYEKWASHAQPEC